MTFNLLRTETVNVLRYLPRFLAKDANFKAAQDAMSWEHERQRLNVIDMAKQAFVTSATWGLADWERIYALTPGSQDTEEYRREKLLTKIRSTRTATPEFMQQIVRTYGQGYVTEHNDQYVFYVYTNCKDPAALAEMKEQIMTYKPAHLGIITYLGYSWNGTITFNGSETYGASMTEWSDEHGIPG